jgi:hypothetical protein
VVEMDEMVEKKNEERGKRSRGCSFYTDLACEGVESLLFRGQIHRNGHFLLAWGNCTLYLCLSNDARRNIRTAAL